ncbi:hypothetical protein [Halocola ammonii]
MHPEDNFDQRVAEILKSKPDSPEAGVVETIAQRYEEGTSYFLMVSDVAYRLGIEISVDKVEGRKVKKQGFTPIMKFTPLNTLEEEPREEALTKRPGNAEYAWATLADKTLKYLSEISEFEEKIDV